MARSYIYPGLDKPDTEAGKHCLPTSVMSLRINRVNFEKSNFILLCNRCFLIDALWSMLCDRYLSDCSHILRHFVDLKHYLDLWQHVCKPLLFRKIEIKFTLLPAFTNTVNIIFFNEIYDSDESEVFFTITQ